MRTPGKWYVAGADIRTHLDKWGKDGWPVAFLYDPKIWGAEGDLESNAALLVAAQDLLEASKLVLEVSPDRLRTEGFRLTTLKAAVAKAEGVSER